MPPGVLVKVPPTGRPLNTTEPVGTEQFGWVIVPTIGAAGKAGAALIVTLFETPDIQPTLLITVKVYVALAGKPEIVAVDPVPVVVVPPGLLVNVQFPAGNPLMTTEPVGAEQAGCALTTTVGGAGGVVFWEMVIAAVFAQPLTPVTVTV